MDKVLNFEEKSISDEENSNEEEEILEEDEMSAEEIEYYRKLTMKSAGFDLNSYTVEGKKKKEKDKKEKKNNKVDLFDFFSEPKTWKSKRADNKRYLDGKVKVERRKFNPRPLPLNWDDEKGCEIVKNVISENSFPTLGLSNESKEEKVNESKEEKVKLRVVKKSKVSSAWSKIMKKKK